MGSWPVSASIKTRTCMIFLSHSYIVLRKDKIFLGSSLLYQSMLAQWKSDGLRLITRKCLDRNEDMYDSFCHTAISSSGRIKLSLGSSLSYQSMLAQWKSDGFIACKYLDRNEDMYDFLISYIVVRKDRTCFT